MNRRRFLQACLAAIGALILPKRRDDSALPKMRVSTARDVTDEGHRFNNMSFVGCDMPRWYIDHPETNAQCPTWHPAGNTMTIDEWISAEKQEDEGRIWIDFKDNDT